MLPLTHYRGHVLKRFTKGQNRSIYEFDEAQVPQLIP